MPRPLPNSFAAICDGRPDDQLAPTGNRLHSFAILQDRIPQDIISLAERISRGLGPNGLGKWNRRRDDRYRTRFANMLVSELGSTGLLHIYEATESEMVACMDVVPHVTPRAGFTILCANGQPVEVSTRGVTTNDRTGFTIPPRAPWNVGVVVTWSALAIGSFYAHARQAAEQLGLAPPTMVLLPDRFPLENSQRPGATSLMRALLHYQLGDRIEQQRPRAGEPDNPAEVLIDNIVGLFNQRHEKPDDEASQVAFRMITDGSLSHRFLCERLTADDLRHWQ